MLVSVLALPPNYIRAKLGDVNISHVLVMKQDAVIEIVPVQKVVHLDGHEMHLGKLIQGVVAIHVREIDLYGHIISGVVLIEIPGGT